jgi:hypothetical protein
MIAKMNRNENLSAASTRGLGLRVTVAGFAAITVIL